MSARTITGARALEKVLGFEEFLGRVEKDQIERLEKTPELFEKYLPYAMALQRGEKMGAGVFRNRLAAAAVVSGLLRRQLHGFLSGERPQYDVHAGRQRDGFVAAQLRRLGIRRRRRLRRWIRRRWWRRILDLFLRGLLRAALWGGRSFSTCGSSRARGFPLLPSGASMRPAGWRD